MELFIIIGSSSCFTMKQGVVRIKSFLSFNSWKDNIDPIVSVIPCIYFSKVQVNVQYNENLALLLVVFLNAPVMGLCWTTVLPSWFINFVFFLLNFVQIMIWSQFAYFSGRSSYFLLICMYTVKLCWHKSWYVLRYFFGSYLISSSQPPTFVRASRGNSFVIYHTSFPLLLSSNESWL